MRLLTIDNLTIAFGADVPVVNRLSFTLNKGDVLGIVGESGSGKSLTALSINGLLPKNACIKSGSIRWQEEDDLLLLPEKQMRHIRGKQIGMIFQEPMTSLNPTMRCGKQLLESVKKGHNRLSDKDMRLKALEWIERVEIPRPEQSYRAYPHQLSGGQKQRMMIAMALAAKPSLLLADEPTTALDVTVQKEIMELIRSLQQEMQLAVIFISHDLDLTAEVAQEIMVMNAGKIVEKKPVEKLINEPEHPYTRGLLACRPPIESRPYRLKSLNTSANHPTPGKQLPAVAEDAQILLETSSVDVVYPLKKNLLGKTLKQLQAVKQVSIAIRRGETFGLVGESGSGKTSLGRAVIQLQEISGGNVYFDGKSIFDEKGRYRKELRKKIQIIFQDPMASLNPKIKIGHAIMEPLKVHGLEPDFKKRKMRALWWLQQMGLEAAHFDRFPHEFSGGQRQRICIARALTLEPELLICDEAVSALDVSVQAQILNLLNECKERLNLSMLFISHDLAVVKYISDRVAVMKDGKLVETADSGQLFKNPAHPYTRKLMNAIPGRKKIKP